MRNTIVKLLMAIAMCFVIGTALVACAGADGKDGTNGKDGKDGKDGTVVTVSDDGYLVLDGVKTQVLVAGQKGDKGDKGEDGAPGAAGLSAYQIWLQAGNEGTEADFLASLVGAAGADAIGHKDCKPESIKTYILEEHDFDNDGAYLDYCVECNDYCVVAYEKRHILEDVVVAQSCLTGAYEGEECFCGYRTGDTTSSRLPHSYEKIDADGNIVFDETKFKPVEGAPYNPCLEPGYVVAYCTNEDPNNGGEVCVGCDSYFNTDPKGHDIDAQVWQKAVVSPKVDAEGEIVVTCSCGVVIDVTLPVQGAKVDNVPVYREGYAKAEDAATCSKDGTFSYYFTIDAEEYDLVADVEVLAYTDVEPARDHVLGVKGNNAATAIKYTDWVEKIAGSENMFVGEVWVPRFVEVDGETVELDVRPYAQDQKFECSDDLVAGWFVCENCKDDEITHGVVFVEVYCNHKGENNADEAVCNEYMELTYDCDECGEKDIVVNPQFSANHTWSYELVEFVGAGANEFKLISKCTADHKYMVDEDGDGVAETQKTEQCWEQHDVTTYDPANVDVLWGYAEKIVIAEKTGNVKATTCYELGWVEWAYTLDNGVVKTIKVDDKELKNHVLLGEEIDLDTAVLYDTTPGIKKFQNRTYDVCGDTYEAYFVCDTCAAYKEENPEHIDYVVCDIIKDCVKSDIVEEKSWAATCTQPGQTTYICPDCGTESVDTIDALGHNFGNFAIVKDSLVKPSFTDAGEVEISAVCLREDCIDATTSKATASTVKFVLPAIEGNIFDAETNEDGVYVQTITYSACGDKGVANYVFTIKLADFFEMDDEDATFAVEFKADALAEEAEHSGANANNIHLVNVEYFDEDGEIEKIVEVTYYECDVCHKYVYVTERIVFSI